MALNPDTPNEAFLREVDENLRRDQLESFAKTYGKWLIGGIVIFLIAVAGWLFWQDRQAKQSAAQSEQLMTVYTDIAAGQFDQAKAKLQPIAESSNETVRALALLTEAAIALEKNDRPAAIANFRAMSEDGSLPQAFQDLALVRLTALEFDSMKPEDVIARLEPLARPGNPWFGSAGELTAMALIKQGQKERAGRLFASIAADRQVPETLRNRSVQIAGTLGVDASAALQQQAQAGSNE